VIKEKSQAGERESVLDSLVQSTMATDLTLWEVGPYHSGLPAPMRLKLKLDGEIIVHTEVEIGFLHKGLEKACELHPWSSLIPYAGHLDPEAAVFGEWSVCLAVEELGGFAVPPRAQGIRIILAELSRISSHLGFVVRMARAVGSETVIHYVLRDREKIHDLFELITGARYSLNFLRFGGVRADVSEGFIERVLEVCEVIRVRMKEYNDILTFNFSFVKRATGLAPLTQTLARCYGITGPNARAAAIPYDIRKEEKILGYPGLDFEVPLGHGQLGLLGDVHDRFLVRLREISQSVEILKQQVESLKSGEFFNSDSRLSDSIPAGEAYSRIESPRGLLGCHLISDGGSRPVRVQFRPPTLANLMAVPELFYGIRLEDFPAVLASLDLGIAEADR